MELDLKGCLRVLWKKRFPIAILLICAVLVSFVASKMMTPVYRASTKILIKKSGPGGGMQLFDELGMGSNNQVQNYVEILRSRSLAEKMGEMLRLDINEPGGRFQALRQGITVQAVQGTDTISVSVESTDPREAARAANCLVEAMIARTQNEEQSDVRAAREFIESQVVSVRDDLTRAEDAVKDYQDRSGVVKPSEEATALVNRLAGLESLRAEADVAVRETQASLTPLERELSTKEQTVVSTRTLIENPVVAQYKSSLADLQVQRAHLLEKYAPSHPSVVALDGQIADIQKELSEEVTRVLSAETVAVSPIHQALVLQITQLKVEIIAAEARRDALTSAIGQAEKQFGQLPARELQLARLVRSQSVLERIYLMLVEKQEEFRISEQMKTANVQVVDPAYIPKSPVRPRAAMNMVVAAFLALFAGCGLAFLLEYLDTTVKTPEDAQQCLDLPVLGLIPAAGHEGTQPRARRTRYVRYESESGGASK